jgi:hypothetical protein
MRILKENILKNISCFYRNKSEKLEEEKYDEN